MTVTPLRQPFPEEGNPTAPPDMTDEVPAEAGKTKSPRGQSTIAFPYADLDDAVSVAKTIRDKGGAPLAKDQLAAGLGQAVTSGAFSAKVHAARMFGLVEFVAGKIKLTELGFESVERDEARVRTAKATAFLNVPLFARAYSEFRNRQLPPKDGLEQAFIGFGVLQTRGANARWAFERSARSAGFFEHAEDRLVQPIVAPIENSSVLGVTEKQPSANEQSVATQRSESHVAAQEFLVRGLLDKMPPTNSAWPITERARWLRTLAVNLAMIYGAADKGEIEIRLPPPPPPPPAAAAVAAKQPPLPAAPSSSGWDQKSGGDIDDEIPF